MTATRETDQAVLISTLNDFLFCPRRAALKLVEGLWEDNAYTLEGSFLHDRADTPGVEERRGVRVVRALPVYSRRLGLVGKADIVEFHRRPDGTEIPCPVDYKRGRKRRWWNDDVQICAQGLCLEEMLGVAVPGGAIFHAGSRRRRDVSFDGALRDMTEQTVKSVREMQERGVVPPPVFHPKCGGCSLRERCLPEVVERPDRVAAYCRELFQIREEG